MSHRIPQGFYVTAEERRALGQRVHEEISDSTRYTPENWAQFKELLDRAQSFKEGCEADGKFSEEQGWPEKAAAYRQERDYANEVLDRLRKRWSQCAKA